MSLIVLCLLVLCHVAGALIASVYWAWRFDRFLRDELHMSADEIDRYHAGQQSKRHTRRRNRRVLGLSER